MLKLSIDNDYGHQTQAVETPRSSNSVEVVKLQNCGVH